MRRLLGAVPALLALAACGGPGAAPASPAGPAALSGAAASSGPAASSGAAASSSPAFPGPAASSGSVLPAEPAPGGEGLLDVTDCGVFTLGQVADLPDHAGRCLVDTVRAGNPARLRVTRPSTEGNPVPVTYTAGTDGRVQVVTDMRQDPFGGRVVTTQTCTGPRWGERRLTFDHCTDSSPTPS